MNIGACAVLLSILPCAVIGDGSVQVTFGSSIKLRSKASTDPAYLASFGIQWNGRPANRNVVIAVKDETMPEIYWTIVNAHDEAPIASGSPVACGSTIRLQHAMTGKVLHADMKHQTTLIKNGEVTAASDDATPTDGNFVVTCEGTWLMNSTVNLKHVNSGALLVSPASAYYTQQNCPRCPMVGHREVSANPNGAHGGEAEWSVTGGVLLHDPVQEDDGKESSDKEEL